jgi:hypothetical protein
MSVNWITPETVVTIASYLLNLDEVAIQKTYQFELDAWIFNLREALQQYLGCVRKEKEAVLNGTLPTLSNRMLAEYCLCSLVECTKAFAGFLTLEVKESLQKRVLCKETDKFF